MNDRNIISTSIFILLTFVLTYMIYDNIHGGSYVQFFIIIILSILYPIFIRNIKYYKLTIYFLIVIIIINIISLFPVYRKYHYDNITLYILSFIAGTIVLISLISFSIGFILSKIIKKK